MFAQLAMRKCAGVTSAACAGPHERERAHDQKSRGAAGRRARRELDAWLRALPSPPLCAALAYQDPQRSQC